MRIILKRSGGLAGLRVTRTVDEATLATHQARKLRRLVKAIEARPRSRKKAAASGSADRFQYHLVVEDQRRTRHIRFGEDTASGSLGTLVAWLNKVEGKSSA